MPSPGKKRALFCSLRSSCGSSGESSDVDEATTPLREGVFRQGSFSLKEYRSAATGEIRCVIHLKGRAAPVAKVLCTLAAGRRYAHVKSVSVAEGFRGRGLGQVLFRELFAIMCSLGVPEVRLEAEEDTQRHNHLVRYYERLGFRVREGGKVLFLNNYDEYYRKVPMYRPLAPAAAYARLHGEDCFLLIRFRTQGGRFLAASSDGSVYATAADAAAAAAADAAAAAAATTADPTAGAAAAAVAAAAASGSGLQGAAWAGEDTGETRIQEPQAEAGDGDPLSVQWVLVQEDDAPTVCFESAHGRFLCAEPDGHVVADRRWDSSWEHFWAEPWEPCHPATSTLTSTNRPQEEPVGAAGVPDPEAAPAAAAAAGDGRGGAGGARQQQQQQQQGQGPETEVSFFTLRTFHGQFLCLDDAGCTISTSDRPAVWRADRTRGICQCDGEVAGGGGPTAAAAAAAAAAAGEAEAETERLSLLRAHLREMRGRQTVAFVTRMRDACTSALANGLKPRMTVRAAIERLRHLRDPHQRLTADAARLLVLTAEDAREAGHPDWMQFVALVHGLGRLLCAFGAEEGGSAEERSCGLSEYAWVVGAPLPPRVPCPDYNADNPDAADDRYQRAPAGMYPAACGLDAALLTWTGPEYLWHVLRHNGAHCRLPPEAMAMVRYWPLEAWHGGGAYGALEGQGGGGDAEMRPWVQRFDAARRATLRSVARRRRRVDWLKSWAWLQPVVDKYAPGELQW